MNIPEEIKIKVKNKEELARENVILLAMSTFPSSFPHEAKYSYKEKNYACIGQLEPGTEHIISLLKEEGKKVDRIVVMTTDKTELKEAGYNGTNYTAVSFFIKQICDYEESIKKENFITVNIEKNQGDATDLWEIVRAIKGNNKKEVDLYINEQGGDRSTIVQSNAVVQLLKDQHVRVKGRYAIKYDEDNPIHEIVEVSEQYKTYDLLSAMTTFKRYGWGQELIEYFDPHQSERDKQLVKLIQTASDAIRLCDINAFDASLANIQTMIPMFDQDQERTLLDIVFEDIKEDYRELLEDNSTISKISWCMKKGYIQQALTIIESQMPEYFLSTVISADFEKTCKIKMGKPYTGQRITLDEAVKNAKKDWEKRENYVFEQWAYRTLHVDRINMPIDGRRWKDYSENYKKESVDNLDALIIPYKQAHNYGLAISTLQLPANADKKKKLSYLVNLHMSLKNQRNLTNHAKNTAERASLRELEEAIYAYVEIAEELCQ